MVHAWCTAQPGMCCPMGQWADQVPVPFQKWKGFQELWVAWRWGGNLKNSKKIQPLQKSQIDSWNHCGGNGAHSENSTKRMIVSKLYDPKLVWKSGQNTQYEVTRSCLSKGPNSRLKWINCYKLASRQPSQLNPLQHVIIGKWKIWHQFTKWSQGNSWNWTFTERKTDISW